MLFRSAFAFGKQVVAVEGFSVEEGSSAMVAESPLGACQAHESGRQGVVVELAPFALDPVALQLGIVRGGCAFYENVPPYGRPGELQEVGSGFYVPEDPSVGALGVELTPILLPTPAPPLAGVVGPEVARERTNIQWSRVSKVCLETPIRK